MMRKSISVIDENKVQLKVKVPNLRDKTEKHIILTVCDQDKSIQELLEYIKSIANLGHSFSIVVDPGNPDHEKKFYVDGDGTDHIYDLIVDEYVE